MEMISWAEEMMPSVNKNPRARSTSLPGVRMVMAIFLSVLGFKFAPVSLISSGSSTATKSLVDRAFPCSNRVISVGDMLSLVDKDCNLVRKILFSEENGFYRARVFRWENQSFAVRPNALSWESDSGGVVVR